IRRPATETGPAGAPTRASPSPGPTGRVARRSPSATPARARPASRDSPRTARDARRRDPPRPPGDRALDRRARGRPRRTRAARRRPDGYRAAASCRPSSRVQVGQEIAQPPLSVEEARLDGAERGAGHGRDLLERELPEQAQRARLTLG